MAHRYYVLDTMRKLNRVLIGLCCLLGTWAFAQSPPKCNSGPKTAWMASEKLSKLIETKGYKEEGEFFFHPLTLGIVGSRLR
jgi:Peptidase propeptide and YPEB domain